VVCQTDTVYILAVDPTNQRAVDKLIAFKDRWPGKAISVAVTDIDMAIKYVDIDDKEKAIFQKLLPGPFTLVMDGKHKVAKGVEAENGTLGIRIPNNKWIADLVKNAGGPVTATSANLSGRTPHYSVESLINTLSEKKKEMIDMVVDAGKLPRNKPSTVIDISKPEIEILRRGELMVGNNQTLISKSVEETEKIATYIYGKFTISKKTISKPLVFLLSGDLGCGKTVFSRAIGKMLGVKEKITSPTFNIYNLYLISPNPSLTRLRPLGYDGQAGRAKTQIFLHFDLYRLEDEVEFEEIKFLEQFSEGVVACVEWPENMGKDNLEKLKHIANVVSVGFEYVDEETREIKY